MLMYTLKNKTIVLAFCLMGFIPAVIWAGEGVDFMNDVIHQFEEMRGELVDNYTKTNRQRVLKKAKELALRIIDVDEIGKLALGDYHDKIKPQQREDFMKLFQELMADRVVNAQIPKNKIQAEKIPIKILKDIEKKDKAFKKDALVVQTQVPHKKIVYDVDFYMFKTADGLKVYDIHIDDSSTLLDYRNQFAQIIRKKGMSYLLKKLRTKLKSLKKK